MSNLQWDEIVAQHHAKRAAEVAMAGMHSIFLLGVNTSQAEDLAAWTRARGACQAIASLPCPCGWYGDADRSLCTCEYEAIGAYQEEHFPGEVDIWLEMPSIRAYDIEAHKQRGAEPGWKVEERIMMAWTRMAGGGYQSLAIDAAGESLVNAAVRHLSLTDAQKERMIRVARTIATLAGEKTIQTSHLAEACQYRPRS